MNDNSTAKGEIVSSVGTVLSEFLCWSGRNATPVFLYINAEPDCEPPFLS